MDHESLDELSSYGMIDDVQLIVCQYVEPHANIGMWHGDNHLHHTTSVIALQIILIFLLSRITHFLLRPCHQTLLISQIVAGIILGPIFLGRHQIHELLFPIASRMTLATFAEFGMVLNFFKMGVQVNPKLILKIEKEAVAIGIVGYLSSFVLSSVVLNVVDIISPLGPQDAGIHGLVIASAQTAFPVISSFLNEMNILNSEIGRMALSTSMVSDACNWVFYFVIKNVGSALEQKSYKPVLQIVVSFCYFSILFFMLRPLVIWISNRNPKGKPMTQNHFLSIICILLFVGFSAQVAGQPSFLVAFWFGLILPDGPPLGSVLAERIDTVGSALIVPAYCTISGLKTNVPSLAGSKSASIEFIIIAGYIGKFIGTILPSLHFKIESRDSFALSLIMCCKGIIDLNIFNTLLTVKEISEKPFTLTVYTMVVVTGFATLVIYYIYDPSRRYKTYMRRSIKDSLDNFHLKLLVCIHNEENVYPMINLLQASNPTKTTPLSVFVLYLKELSGRATSILTKNKSNNKSCRSKETSSQHITNVFAQFRQHNEGCVKLQCFTSIAPYASMHDDICYMAMDSESNIVIVPFHKQWSINGNVTVSNASIRTLNQKVLSKVPCSVGVYIDRSQIMSGKPLVINNDNSICEIAMIFFGGADDQEALAYSIRIAQHPNVKFTLFWVRVKFKRKQRNKKNPFIDLMEQTRYSTNLKGRVIFKEEIVEDGFGTRQVIRKMEGHFSLVIVGRHHIPDSPCTLGLTEWCELSPELGPVGSFLATSDFTFSVLVVQRQPFNHDFQCVT